MQPSPGLLMQLLTGCGEPVGHHGRASVRTLTCGITTPPLFTTSMWALYWRLLLTHFLLMLAVTSGQAEAILFAPVLFLASASATRLSGSTTTLNDSAPQPGHPSDVFRTCIMYGRAPSIVNVC